METAHKNDRKKGLGTKNWSVLKQHTTKNVSKDAINNHTQLAKQCRRKNVDHWNLTRYLFANKFSLKAKPFSCFVKNESGSVSQSVAVGIKGFNAQSSTSTLLGIIMQWHWEASSEPQVKSNWLRTSVAVT